MGYKICSRCIMDNKTDTKIIFDKNGYCNYCNDVIKRMPEIYFPEQLEGGIKLESIIDNIKEDCKDDEFDCMLGVSGGIDSSFVWYLGAKYGLRMLAVHIDDGLDNPIAVENLKKLHKKTNSEYITITPNREEYADVIYSLLKASVSNLAFGQDNLIMNSLQKFGEEKGIKYILDGHNFAHECILERGNSVNFSDKSFVLGIHDMYGRIPIRNLEFMSLSDRYIKRNMKKSFKHVRPLNYVDYNLEKALITLEDFCGFEYYGGKHYESILTRFMQCYYLPEKFGIDKRKSHLSSLIITGQIEREDALRLMNEPLYKSEQMLSEDKKFIARYLNITTEELDQLIAQPPLADNHYKHSVLNNLAPIARNFRKFLE